MAIETNSLVEISLRGSYLGVVWNNIWSYQMGQVPNTVTPVQIAEAWWNHVKVAYRGLMPNNVFGAFQSVIIREMNNPSGDIATYGIPPSEQNGNRNGAGDVMPPFVAFGLRLNVGTRTTRPGSKRIPGVGEGDNGGGSVTAGTIPLVVAVGNAAGGSITLGAPAATTVMRAQVFRKGLNGTVLAFQQVVSTSVNPALSSQTSRKFGRGG